MTAPLPVKAESDDAEKVRTVSAQLVLPPEKLLNSLTYSHFELLVALDDPFQRAFYEVEYLRCGWSVRELKRIVIGGDYFFVDLVFYHRLL